MWTHISPIEMWVHAHRALTGVYGRSTRRAQKKPCWRPGPSKNFLILVAASRDLLNPLLPPRRRLEGICKILCLVHDLTVAELHDAHGICWSPLVSDCVFRNPEITVSENPLDVEAGRLARMMTPQGLQVASPVDSLT